MSKLKRFGITINKWGGLTKQHVTKWDYCDYLNSVSIRKKSGTNYTKRKRRK